MEGIKRGVRQYKKPLGGGEKPVVLVWESTVLSYTPFGLIEW